MRKAVARTGLVLALPALVVGYSLVVVGSAIIDLASGRLPPTEVPGYAWGAVKVGAEAVRDEWRLA